MEDYNLKSYHFDLPEKLIAQHPPLSRGASRLLVMQRKSQTTLQHALFKDIVDYLPKNALLIANNSKVLPARLIGKRPGGGKVEILLLTPLPLVSNEKQTSLIECLVRPAAKFKPGTIINFGDIQITILNKGAFGKAIASLKWKGDLETLLSDIGHIPLPPYIKRCPDNQDAERYQTIYASNAGSVAAPTAGLHFTSEVQDAIKSAGIEWRELSLHVGYGTFSPVREPDIRAHKMHSELAVINKETALAIRKAKQTGRPVIAIGTTSARALEGAFIQKGNISAFKGMIDIFLYPGKQFNVIDGLLTNFHLPESSLLMLVSAFTGREAVLDAYKKAINAGYRFFSYGDAMLITPEKREFNDV